MDPFQVFTNGGKLSRVVALVRGAVVGDVVRVQH